MLTMFNDIDCFYQIFFIASVTRVAINGILYKLIIIILNYQRLIQFVAVFGQRDLITYTGTAKDGIFRQLKGLD